MDDFTAFLNIIKRAGDDPDEVLTWMNCLIDLGEDYATNGPSRPNKSDTAGKRNVQYALLGLRMLVQSAQDSYHGITEADHE